LKKGIKKSFDSILPHEKYPSKLGPMGYSRLFRLNNV
jgi:hypothetical protein